MWSGIGGVVFGCLLIHAWWLETYTDSPLAISWRRMSAAMSPTRSAQAILRPCVGLMFVGAGFGMLLQKIGAPTFLWYPFGAAGLLALVIGVVYLLPFPLPRFADPYYQYLKRHGLLDATGHPLPDAERHGTHHDVPVGVDPPRPGRPAPPHHSHIPQADQLNTARDEPTMETIPQTILWGHVNRLLTPQETRK